MCIRSRKRPSTDVETLPLGNPPLRTLTACCFRTTMSALHGPHHLQVRDVFTMHRVAFTRMHPVRAGTLTETFTPLRSAKVSVRQYVSVTEGSENNSLRVGTCMLRCARCLEQQLFDGRDGCCFWVQSTCLSTVHVSGVHSCKRWTRARSVFES